MWCVNATITLTHAKRATRERALAGWTEKWKKTYPGGRFGPADRIPPAWKPKSHFTSTKREVYGRLIQCRTGHAFLGEYYTKFTREHVLRECERYEEHRGVLREVSAEISGPDILGTEKGIQALAKFLERCGAFTKTGQRRAEAAVEPTGRGRRI
ncbi:hypothetical protein C8J57DRAFT_1382723 [Mycena rebaudengoi]|nr:hypothetical protein C8J57DRAFT_1382723 [Mycena rebaudengoi]